MSWQNRDNQQPQVRHQAAAIVNGKFSAAGNRLLVGGILLLALIAFEMFNFDTTRFALASLLGGVSFLGLTWAAILAVAFCAIDFAGLVHFFMPEEQIGQSKGYWYMMGAWLLGATMNAIMTWWAVSLTLLNHNLGNEVLSRAQLLEIVPIFVAVLVWLTRILFIGALTVAGGYFFAAVGKRPFTAQQPALPQQPAFPQQPRREAPRSETPRPQPVRRPAMPPLPAIDNVPAFLEAYEEQDWQAYRPSQPVSTAQPNAPQPGQKGPRPAAEPVSRIQRRPPAPLPRRPMPAPFGASPRRDGSSNRGDMR